MSLENQKYVIGVDGGGTKTVAALSDLKGKILKIGESGSSHPRNLGLKKAVDNAAKAIKQVLKRAGKGKILSTFIGLPALAEEFKFRKKEIEKEFKRHKGISKILKGKVEIGSDQETAFRAATDGDGVMLNSGTGCVARGWKGKKQAHASGWGWLGDEGGAFFVGQKVFQAVMKDLDGRGARTRLTKSISKKFRLKKEENFLNLVYQKDPVEIIPSFTVLCDKASKEGDRIAKEIMIEAANEAFSAARAVIKKLNLENEKFPLVITGSMFKSKIFLDRVKKEIRKLAPKVEFVRLKGKPVIGAVKIALENKNVTYR